MVEVYPPHLAKIAGLATHHSKADLHQVNRDPTWFATADCVYGPFPVKTGTVISTDPGSRRTPKRRIRATISTRITVICGDYADGMDDPARCRIWLQNDAILGCCVDPVRGDDHVSHYGRWAGFCCRGPQDVGHFLRIDIGSKAITT